MTEPRTSSARREFTWPNVSVDTDRRLSDRLKQAIQQACAQGRREIAERLTLVYHAIVEEDLEHHLRRRREDWEAL